MPQRKGKNASPVVSPRAPKLTKENFEKELKDLAAKAKEQTWARWARGQLWVLIKVAVLLMLAAIYSNVSQLTLSPVFGSIPASIWHPRGVIISCFLGWCSNLFLDGKLPYKPIKILPVVAGFIPVVQYALCKWSGFLGSTYGPVIIEGLTFYPLLMLTASCSATILEDIDLNLGVFQWIAEALPGLICYPLYKGMEQYSKVILQEMIGQSFLQTRLGFEISLAGVYSILAPSELLLFSFPPLLHAFLLNVHVPTPWITEALNDTLNDNGWSLLARKESVTGYLSVIESTNNGYRVLRCDHSLLGGEWKGSATPSGTKEPIYSIFVMLEAVRLIEVPVHVPDEKATALVVGLGIGTTPSALIKHGIDTTIVEIDPIVYDWATKYFDLPPNHTAVIADAVTYASASVAEGQQFDYIIHDVFTGGAEPVDLFTFEFLRDLNSLLKPNGVVAINYAGDLALPSGRIIINTVLASFPTCRIYRELDVATSGKIQDEGKDFTNMVIFCTKATSGSIKFRKPKEADYLGSEARKKFLLPQHEVSRDEYALQESDAGILRRNDTGRVEKWHQKSAVGHWALMRTVLPAVIWESW